MKIIFTRSDKKFSKMIIDITEEPVSHCAILIDNAWVIHSNLLGVHVEHISTFTKASHILYSVDVPDMPVDKILSNCSYGTYDYGAFIFLGGSLLLRKYFKNIMPKQNLWQTTGMFLCTEWITKNLADKEDGMITPYQLYLKLLDKYQSHYEPI